MKLQDITNLKKLPDDTFRNKFIGLSTLVTMLFFITFIFPQIKANKDLKSKIIDLEANRDQITDLLNRDSEIETKTIQLLNINEELLQKTQSNLKTNDLAVHITKIAKNNKIKTNIIRLSTEKDTNEILNNTSIKLEVISFVINFECDLISFYQFLIDLHSLKTPLTIDNININQTGSKTKTVNIDCNINFYLVKGRESTEDGS